MTPTLNGCFGTKLKRSTYYIPTNIYWNNFERDFRITSISIFEDLVLPINMNNQSRWSNIPNFLFEQVKKLHRTGIALRGVTITSKIPAYCIQVWIRAILHKWFGWNPSILALANHRLQRAKYLWSHIIIHVVSVWDFEQSLLLSINKAYINIFYLFFVYFFDSNPHIGNKVNEFHLNVSPPEPNQS